MPKSFLIRSKRLSRSKYLSRDSSSSVNDVINTSHQDEAQVIFTDESKTSAGPQDASKSGAKYSDVISLINKKEEFGTKMEATNFSQNSNILPNQSMKSISSQMHVVQKSDFDPEIFPVTSLNSEIYAYKQCSESVGISPSTENFQNKNVECTVSYTRKDYISNIQNAMFELMFRNYALVSLINSKKTKQLNDNNNVNNTANKKSECQLCLRNHHDEKHLDPTPTRVSRLRSSRKLERTAADRKSLQCLYCKKSYKTLPAFSMHLRTHTHGFPCAQCGKTFSRPWLLQGHIRTHTGDKPYECVVCGKRFSDRSNQRAHLQIHSSVKPYLCSRCGKTFTLRSYLYKHQEFSCVKLTPAIKPSLSTVTINIETNIQ